MDIVIISHKDFYTLEYNGVSCKVVKPNDNQKYYIVCQNGNNACDDSMFDIINLYCIEKNPTEKKINKKIVDAINAHIKLPCNKDTNTDYYKTKSIIQKFAETSASIISAKSENKAIFDKQNVINLLVNEFMECWESSRTNNQFTIELLNNNIFSWKVCMYFKNSKLLNMQKKYAEVHIFFHDVLYPNYPPSIKIIRPIFSNKLGHRITNSKMTQLEYWTPSRSIKYIINRISYIIETYGVIDPAKQYNHEYTKDLSLLETYLDELPSHIGTVNENDEIDSGENYIKMDTKKPNREYIEKYWKQGTGFGHSDSANWNPDNYIKLQEEKNNNIAKTISNINTVLSTVCDNDKISDQVYNIIEKSLLISFLIQQFRNTNVLDILEKSTTYMLYSKLIKLLGTEKFIDLFKITYNGTNLYNVLSALYGLFDISLKLHKDKSIISKISEELKNVIAVCKVHIPETKQAPIKKNDVGYVGIMNPLRFEYAEILKSGYKKEYTELFKKESNSNWKQCHRRLSAEIPTLMQENQLPINETSSIFLRVDENNSNIMRALIVGPENTPYDSGCFIFDIYLSTNYPKSCPKMWFMNHGGNRFNPNLYECGKVCLSILDTYIGPASSKSEEWNEKYSTILQVLISIQAQILVEEPWFNEPGREASINTQDGKNKSDAYNKTIRLYTLKSTMLDLLENPDMYPQFKNVIVNHFKYRKNYIISLCEKWYKESKKNKQQCGNMTNKIIELLNNL